jgi:Insertion element 4 transposase N-terminal
VLTRLVHRDLVDEVLTDTDRTERRRRLLPARVVVYFVLAMTPKLKAALLPRGQSSRSHRQNFTVTNRSWAIPGGLERDQFAGAWRLAPLLRFQ